MIQLTQKGKEIYGDCNIIHVYTSLEPRNDVKDFSEHFKCIYGFFIGKEKFHILASNPTELKALIDLGLVEIV